MQITALAQKNSLELKKHVGLIHSTNKLSLLERKIANALLYNAYEQLLTRNEHSIHIPSLCFLIGYNSKDYKTIKHALVSLISTVLEWNLVDKNKKEGDAIWMASSMLADAKIEGPICTYSYSNRMKELCHYPEFYGRLNMQVMSMFKSTYGLALYENCIRYQNISQTPWFNLPIYRKLMGVADSKYKVFRDFNNRVIKPSVKEVNKYSPIFVNQEFMKKGRGVVAIRFLISKQSDKTFVSSIEKSDVNKSIIERLKDDYGLSAEQIKAVVSKYDDLYLLDKMSLIESSSSYQNGKIQNLAKYLEKALIEDFQAPKSSKENLEKLRIKHVEKVKIRKLHEQNLQRYRAYQNKQLPTIYDRLTGKEKMSIEKSFDLYISSTLYYNLFIKEGLNNSLVCDRFADFVRNKHPELLASLLSFDEYCKLRNL